MGTFATVLGLDLACLSAALCGLGAFPGLLMHDSPREADMEPQTYHRLFGFLAALESWYPGTEPAFQCIVTTTTPPPAQLAGKPWVRAELHSREPDGYLMRQQF